MTRSPTRTVPSVVSGAVTHTGAVRTLNEDAHLTSPWLCLVADGMGGHDGGEVASRIVVDAFAEHADRPLTLGALEPLIADVNRQVHGHGERSGHRGMGSTLVGVAVVDNGGSASAVVFNVGDSRCYRLAGDELAQVTTDHSHVQELIDAGELTAREAATHPLRNVVTRALGPDDNVLADFVILADEACRLLLCSDGVSGELDDETIHRLLSHGDDPQTTALALVEAVLQREARDNITAVVVDIGHADDADITVPKETIEQRSSEITAPRRGLDHPSTAHGSSAAP